MIDASKLDVFGGVSKGAYVLEDVANPQVILIGTGSEVWPAVDAAKLLGAEGIAARVVSMPSWEIFDEPIGGVQGERAAGGCAEACRGSRRNAGLVEVCWPGRRRCRVGSLWRVGTGPEVLEEFGFTGENVAKRAKLLLKK